MECKNCNSRCETGKSVSMLSGVCPFCGAALAAADADRPDRYDSSKDALAAIMRKHGAEALLGDKLENFFKDYAPGVKERRRNVVFLVPKTGAAEILKRNLATGAAEQEIAYRQAVQRVLDKYPIERSEIESVLLEFTDALGWRINVQATPQTPAPEPEKPQAAPQQPQTQPKPAQQVKFAPPKLTYGQRNVSFGNYLWRVLDVKDGRALLLAEEILEQRKYHSEWTAVTWETCDLRKYLNGAFLQTFSSQEQERIAQTEIRNADNPWFGTSGGRDTVDKIFLLSIEEVVKYFGDSGQLREQPKGVYRINDEYNGARIAKYQGEEGWWWLRSPGLSDDDAAFVGVGGRLRLGGYGVISEYGGVRPALWLNPDS